MKEEIEIPFLCNRYISDNYFNSRFYISELDLIWNMAKNIIQQWYDDNRKIFITDNLQQIILEFKTYLNNNWFTNDIWQELSYEELSEILSESNLYNIVPIKKINNLRPYFIDISSLGRNVFYDTLRSSILNWYILTKNKWT